MSTLRIVCQRLEDLHNSVNQYFPKDQWPGVTKSSTGETPRQTDRKINRFSCNRVQNVHWYGFRFHAANNP